MQDHVAALTPVFAAVEDRLHALDEAEQGLAPDVRALLRRFAAWLDAGAGDSQALREALQTFGDAADATDMSDSARSPWGRALRLGLAARLAQLVEGWQACVQLRGDIDRGLLGAPMPTRDLSASAAQALHRDHGMAALSALAAFLAVGAACAFWMLTAWPMGSAAAMMAAVFCSFFATMDDPVPMIHGFLKYTLWSVPIAALYVLVLLPLVRDIASLALVCAPVFLLLGCFIARPATAMAGMAVLFGVAGALSAHDTATADFVSFLNSTIGQVVGIVIAARTTRLVRSVGADWMARRIQRATRRELGELAAGHGEAWRDDGFAARALDRIGLLAPRVAQQDGSTATAEALRDLRLGGDIVALQRTLAALPLGAVVKIRALLAELARLFRQRDATLRPAALLQQLDAGLAATLDATAGHGRRSPEQGLAVAALVGLRRHLFGDAPPPAGAAFTPHPQAEAAT